MTHFISNRLNSFLSFLGLKISLAKSRVYVYKGVSQEIKRDVDNFTEIKLSL